MDKSEGSDNAYPNIPNTSASSSKTQGYCSSKPFYDKFYAASDSLGSVNDTFNNQVVLDSGASCNNCTYSDKRQVGITTEPSNNNKKQVSGKSEALIEDSEKDETQDGLEQIFDKNELYFDFENSERQQQGYVDQETGSQQSAYEQSFAAIGSQNQDNLSHGFWCPNPVDAAVCPNPGPRIQFRSHGVGPAFPRYIRPRGWWHQGPWMGGPFLRPRYPAWQQSPYTWINQKQHNQPYYQNRHYSKKPPSNKPEGSKGKSSKQPHQTETELQSKEKLYRRREAELLKREWEDFPEATQVYNENPQLWLSFTVASYNILSQDLCDNNDFLYKHCDPSDLEWSNRRQRLMSEINFHKPDVLCLQEVNAEHYSEYFVQEFNNLGYQSIFKKRTGDKEDGCAIVYKTEKFELAGHQGIEYFRSGISLLDRDNVGLVAVLKFVDTEKHCPSGTKTPPYICVANTHLLFNLKRGDIKLAQMQILLSEIDEWAAKYVDQRKGRYDPTKTLYAPVILCGDFNSLPFSPMYNFITTGHINYAGMDAKTICQNGVYGQTRILKNQLIPEHVGITNKCRKTALLAQQISQYRNHTDVRKQKVNELALVKSRRHTEKNCLKRPDESMHKTSDASGTKQKESSACKQDAIQASSSDSSKKVEDRCCKTDAAKNDSHEHAKTGQSMGETSRNDPENYIKEFSHIMERPVKNFHNLFSNSDGTLSHPFSFKSIYGNFNMDQNSQYYGYPYVTTSHTKAAEMVDFIFYFNPKKKLKKRYPANFLMCQSRLCLLTDKQMQELGRLPNDVIGSDHCMLLSSFMLYNTYYEWKLKNMGNRKKKYKKRKRKTSVNNPGKKKKNSS